MNLIFKLKKRYLFRILNKKAKEKYRVIKIDKNIYRLQVYDNLSLTKYRDLTYGKIKYKDNWQWHDILTETSKYEELISECNYLRLEYKLALIYLMRKNKNKKKYPIVIY